MNQEDNSHGYIAKFFDKLRCLYNELKQNVSVEFEKNPYLVIFLGTLCIFCAIPLSGLLIFSVLSTLVLLAIFLVVEGVVLGCSLLFFMGSTMFMTIVGAFAAALVTSLYFGYKQIEKLRIKVE